MALGAVFLLAPGMIDPMTVINGSTLIGLALLGLSGYKLTKEATR